MKQMPFAQVRDELQKMSSDLFRCSALANMLKYEIEDSRNESILDTIALSYVLTDMLETMKFKISDIRVSLFGTDE